jgi:hypothetical protein
VLHDEFLTTAEAQEELIAADVSRQRRRVIIDQMAAAKLLEGFLRARQEQAARQQQQSRKQHKKHRSDGAFEQKSKGPAGRYDDAAGAGGCGGRRPVCLVALGRTARRFAEQPAGADHRSARGDGVGGW